MYWSAVLVALVPPGVVTVTSTAPSVPVAGAVAVIVVALLTVNAAGLPGPKLTAVAPVNPVPVMVTDVPPVLGPEPGLTPVTVGAGGGCRCTGRSALVALVPPAVVTVTSTAPPCPPGRWR